MFVKEDKRGQHYYSLIFCISQREYKKISEASSHVNVWEEPEDGFSSVSYQKQLSLTSAGMFSNWSSGEVADWSNKTFFWCFSSGSGSFHLLTKTEKEQGAAHGGHRRRWNTFTRCGFCLGNLWSALLWAQFFKQAILRSRAERSAMQCNEDMKTAAQGTTIQESLDFINKNTTCISVSHPRPKWQQERTPLVVYSTDMAITNESYRFYLIKLPFQEQLLLETYKTSTHLCCRSTVTTASTSWSWASVEVTARRCADVVWRDMV